MNKDRNNQNGITLAMLAVMIFVMLVLAGVVMQRVSTDNGILTESQNASFVQSKAVLQEYINTFYAENSATFYEYNTKIEALQANSQSSNWIYSPAKYMDDQSDILSDEYAIYLIDKEALPERIKNQIKGGDSSKEDNESESNMKDVYGITENLVVYYCEDGLNSIMGIKKQDLDINAR